MSLKASELQSNTHLFSLIVVTLIQFLLIHRSIFNVFCNFIVVVIKNWIDEYHRNSRMGSSSSRFIKNTQIIFAIGKFGQIIFFT